MTPHDQSLTISLTVDDPKAALEFYEKAFHAEILSKWEMPDGTVVHADLKFGNTLFYLSGEYPDWRAVSPKAIGGAPSLLCIRDDAYETWFKQGLELGAEELQPMQTFPWGVRAGVLIDPFGYRWAIGKQVEEVSQEEVMRRMMGMG